MKTIDLRFLLAPVMLFTSTVHALGFEDFECLRLSGKVRNAQAISNDIFIYHDNHSF